MRNARDRLRPSMDALNKLFRPRSVAIVGASPVAGTARNSLVRVLVKHGFSGKIYPVNPKQTQIEGMPCYADVASLPEAPDVAMIITPAATVPDLIRECGAAGIAAAIVFSSGFEETEAGKTLADDLSAAVEESNVTVLGPNCQGVWSIADNTMLTFGPAARKLDTLIRSPVAVISQSGALGGAIANHFQATGIGSSYIISVGNETTTDILDGLRWVIEQDDIKVVVLYVEGLDDGAELLRLAERAHERGVQIVAIKSGVSKLGQAATASHTGKIASAGSVYGHVFEQVGVIRVDSLDEIFSTVKSLIVLPDPRISNDPQGGVAVVSTSGGACALLADHCDQDGVPMATFSDEVAQKLVETLPDFARTDNPVDVTGQIRAVPDLLKNTMRMIASDPRTEVIVIQLSSSGQSDITENREDIRQIAREAGLPIVVSVAGEEINSEDVAFLRDSGAFVGFDPASAIRAIRRIYQRQSYQSRPKAEARTLPGQVAVPTDWPSIMRYLADCGIDTPEWTILKPGDSAAQACKEMSFPLVVKALPEDAEHKTELGLVKLHVESAEEVDEHAGALRAIMNRPEAGVLVQEMVSGEVEVVLSCLRHTDFGPVINIGMGGVAIELFRDVAHLALPVSADQVRTALRQLKLWELLQGFRGRPRTDIEALVAATVALGDRFLATPGMAEFEVNPLMVMAEGDGLLAVDALVSTDN